MRTLSKDNAEDVGRHLIMAGILIDVDSERAYRHAKVAASRGGRVDVTREALGLAAFQTGRYAEALREFRTVRRLNGSNDYVPQMAASERALGKPEKAIEMVHEVSGTLSEDLAAELRLVEAHSRMDLGDLDTAEAILTTFRPVVEEQGDKRDALLSVLETLRESGEVTPARIDALLSELEAAADAAEDAEGTRETIVDEIVLYDTAELEPEPDPVDEDPVDDERSDGVQSDTEGDGSPVESANAPHVSGAAAGDDPDESEQGEQGAESVDDAGEERS